MKLIHLIIGLVTFIAVGCAHASDPVSPIENPPGNPQLAEARTSQAESNHMLWAWAELRCNTQTAEVELVPKRASTLHLNVLNPLMATVGMGVVIDPGASDPPNGLFVMDISLTHPFPGRDQLCGFDVKGILITPGTFTIGPLVLAGPGETELLNRDGLTRWWNPTEFTGGGLLGYSPGSPGCPNPDLLTATVNPYKAFADTLSAISPSGCLLTPSLDDDDGRAIFTAGASNTRRYEIQFPVSGGPVVIFNYAVDASWDFPDPNPPNEVPDDFPMNANQPEAFIVGIPFPTNTLEYLEGGTVTGELHVGAIISDWQGLATGNIQDEVSTVRAFAPTLLSDGATLSYTGGVPGHAIYEADLTPYLLSLSSGDPHLLLVRVGAEGAGHYTQGGINIGPAEPISAFQSRWVEIATVTCEPDDNDDFSDAVPLDFGEFASGTLCRPGGDLIDYRDFYSFTVPAGDVFGSIDLYCTVEPTRVAIFDSSYVKLAEEYVSSGAASIDVGPLALAPEVHYIRVLTQNEDQILNYQVSNNIHIDPCDDPIAFTYETKIDVPEENCVDIGRKSILVHNDHVWAVYSEGGPGAQTVLCRHSPDGGQTFYPPAQVNTLEIACKRMWPCITRDNDGNLYCAWVDYSSGEPEPFVSMSSDNGVSWSLEVNIYDFETGSLQPNNEMKGIFLGTDDSGRLHAVWMDRRVLLQQHLYYSYSDDQGATWEPAELIDDGAYEIQNTMRGYDFDVSGDGVVAVAWMDRRHIWDPPLSSLDVYFDKRDALTPFGTDVMVHSPDVDIEQSYPAVAIHDDGTIHVVWVDRRNDGSAGGSNPWNTWEPYYARSEDGGSTFIAEQEIPTSEGYTQSSDMQLRVEVSPWGNVYAYYKWGHDDLLLSRSCDGGDTWEMPVTVFQDTYDSYFLGNLSFDLGDDGAVYALHVDTRIEPGGDYSHWNLFMEVSE